jgi:hypothetical protein
MAFSQKKRLTRGGSSSTKASRSPKRAQCVASQVILLYDKLSRFIMMESVMSTAVREKFSSQAAPEVLAALRQIAEAQGRQFQAVLDEALREYIDRQQKERPRRHVMASFASSLEEFDSLYRELTK